MHLSDSGELVAMLMCSAGSALESHLDSLSLREIKDYDRARDALKQVTGLPLLRNIRFVDDVALG